MMQERKRLGLAIPYPLYKKIVEEARGQGKTINSICLDIFWEWKRREDTAKPSADTS
jgi:hypothetical protein